LFSAFVFSFSSHALIKEFLFSVSTLARARSLSLEPPCFSAAGFSGAGSSATSGKTEK